jgi:hypothetical protein
MKTIILFFLILFSTYSKADTIAHWTVYLNGKKLKTFNTLGDSIGFKASQLKLGDKLSIHYFDDTKCKDCTYELLIRNSYKDELVSKKFKNETELVELDLTEVIKDDLGSKPRKFFVFLLEFRKRKLINYGLRLFTFTIN